MISRLWCVMSPRLVVRLDHLIVVCSVTRAKLDQLIVMCSEHPGQTWPANCGVFCSPKCDISADYSLFCHPCQIWLAKFIVYCHPEHGQLIVVCSVHPGMASSHSPPWVKIGEGKRIERPAKLTNSKLTQFFLRGKFFQSKHYNVNDQLFTITIWD